MNIVRSLFVLFALFAYLPLALAHGGGPHVMGTLKSVDDKSITVTGTDGKDVTVAVNDKTTVEVGGKAATIKDVKAGDRVVVHTKKSDSGLVAVTIKSGAMDKTHAHHDDDHMEHHDGQPAK